MTASASITPVHAPPTAAPPAPLRATRGERLTCAILALAAAAVIGIAAWLQPSPAGVGTHQALGLAPCGWMSGMGIPCPTCGMTTSFAHAAHGDLAASFRAQPMGLLLAVGTAAAGLVALHVAATGSRLGHLLGARLTPRAILALAVLALLAWGWKFLAVRGFPATGGAP